MEKKKLITELKELIIKVLKLEDIAPDDIDNEAPLFGEGLGLDSIDALELVVALVSRRTYTWLHRAIVASLVALPVLPLFNKVETLSTGK